MPSQGCPPPWGPIFLPPAAVKGFPWVSETRTMVRTVSGGGWGWGGMTEEGRGLTASALLQPWPNQHASGNLFP